MVYMAPYWSFTFIQFFMPTFLIILELVALTGFILQLRSMDDHSPLHGITVGDIGPKFGNGGFNSMDNGLLIFDNVRIPRDQMFMRQV